MASVVLDIQADSGGGQPEQNSQQQSVPPGLGPEHQQHIRSGEAGKEEDRLQVHLPTVALASAGNSKILFDPSTELELEGVIVPEFQASCQF